MPYVKNPESPAQEFEFNIADTVVLCVCVLVTQSCPSDSLQPHGL